MEVEREEGSRRIQALRRHKANSAGVSDPVLQRLADAVLIPPFPGHDAPRWVLDALERGLAGVTIFGPNIAGPEQLAALTAPLPPGRRGSR